MKHIIAIANQKEGLEKQPLQLTLPRHLLRQRSFAD